MEQTAVFNMILGQYITTMWFPLPERQYSLGPGGNIPKLDYLRRILADAYRSDMNVTLAFMPFHAALLEAMYAVGLRPQFDEWRRQVLLLNEGEAAAAGRTPFSVWDFTGYNSVNTEPIPPPGDASVRMRWYNDATHISAAGGRLMQDVLWGMSAAPGLDFGRLVNSRTLDALAAQDALARTRYEAAFPDEVTQINRMVSHTRKERK
jgi:hypothetical protein